MTQSTGSAGKADFHDIYDRPDPRAYFRTLGALDYEIPQRAAPVFQDLLAALRPEPAADESPLRVLDLCCSYGVNAALMRHDVELPELVERYTGPAVADLSPEELCRQDRDWFSERTRPDAAQVYGLDCAGNAIGYGCQAGLLQDGWAEDLEAADPSAQLVGHLDGVDLVTTTGGVGYITERTFDRVLGAQTSSVPWVAAFVLRMFDYDEISRTLARHGLVTETLPSVTFPQRRFATDDEQAAAVAAVQGRGLDPAGLEDAGQFHAGFFLSRPADDVAARPLIELLEGAGAP